MAILHAVLLALTAAAVIFATARRRADPVLAVLLGTAAFGAACGLSVGQLGKSFGSGFGSAAAGPGLAVLAAALIAALAATSAAGPPGARANPRGVMPVLGLLAGLAASPASAFAILSPLREAYGASAIRLGLAISAGQGLLLPSPVTVAATVILGADWRLVLAIGLPCAVALVVGAGRLRRKSPAQPVATRPRNIALLGTTTVLLALLIVQSLGDIPSEPLGGGGRRELILGLGRPFILLLAGVALMVFAKRKRPWSGFSTQGFAGAAIARAAPLVVLVGAAGGLQSIAQDTRVADFLAEPISGWQAGLLVPFLTAAALKLLQGNSLVAAITAAGMVQPSLAALGLADPVGRACAVLAIGAGAVAGTHINDPFFWLVTEESRLRKSAAPLWLTAGTLLQGVCVLAILSLIRLAT